MSEHFRAVAIDYDGTLTEEDRPPREVLEAIAAVRSSGRSVVLVTGRVLEELRRVFPEVERHFDAIVAENGAVLALNGTARSLAAAVPAELDEPLVERGISFQRGQVLLACAAEHELEVWGQVRRLGLDVQLVRNRQALMVLPSGISKGSGVLAALHELGLSSHNVIGIGDAENDLALLERCEVGVAVGNAVETLKRRADVVLAERSSQAVVRFLEGPLLRGELRVEPRRWQIELGRTPAGDPVRLPASQVNLLITGGSGSGKSYAAGLLAEQLVTLGYSLCILDPEGDHAALSRLPGVVSLDAGREASSPEIVTRLMQSFRGSVVLDLTGLREGERMAYFATAIQALRASRARCGMPHWIFLDEAHVPLHLGGALARTFDLVDKGYCLATYRPDQLCGGARDSFDFLLVLAGERGLDPAAASSLQSLLAESDAELGAPPSTELGQGLLMRLGRDSQACVVDLGSRLVRHVRHWHKYASGALPEPHRFYFTTEQGPTGVTASNLAQLHRELALCGAEVLERHARSYDLSRWIEEVIQDRSLAADVRPIEALAGTRSADWIRHALLRAIEARYLD